MRPESNSRVVGLESAPCHGIVGLGQGRLKVSRARQNQGVLGRGLVDGVADPGVPAGLDLAGIVVVLGVVDPAGSEGEFLEVLVEFVAGAIGADEGTGLGVTCLPAVRGHVAEGLGETEVGIPMYCSRKIARAMR